MMTKPEIAGVVTGPTQRLRQHAGGAVGSIAITLTMVVLVGVFWVGERFLSVGNLTIIGSFVAVPLIVGVFASFCLLSGVVDLSIGSMVAFSAATFATLYDGGWAALPAAIVTVLLCALFGVVNGIAIVAFGADAIACTLGMLTVLRGATRVVLEGHSSMPALVPDFFSFTTIRWGPLPIIFAFGLIGAAMATVLVLFTRLGRHIRAAGGDAIAARRAGINVSLIRFVALVVVAIGASVGGILYVGQLGGASAVLGDGLEFEVYAALLIGGYSIMRGGVGNPAGGVMGVLVVAGLTNILDVQGVSNHYVHIVVGILLVGAVILDRLRGGDEYE